MDKTATIVIAYLLALVGAFFAGRATVKCPEVDRQTIELLEAQIKEKDDAIERHKQAAIEAMRVADSIAALSTKRANEVLPTIPRGRTTAELDSIGAIIFEPW